MIVRLWPQEGFLRSMPGWFQLHVEDAVLEDLSALTQEGIYLSELVILVPEGSNDKERWKAVRCGKYTYHEYKTN